MSACHFDSATHEYRDALGLVPHVTGIMLECGYIDDTWYTEAGQERGTAIHDLTLSYELGALELQDAPAELRPWVSAYIAAMNVIRPTWTKMEEPSIHPVHRFGYTADRVGLIYSLGSVLDLKTGARTAVGARRDMHPVQRALRLKAEPHAIQTALYAIGEAEYLNLPAEQIARWTLYLKDNGKWSLDQHQNRHDISEARRVIAHCCEVAA